MLPSAQGGPAASSSQATLTLLALPGDVLALIASKLHQLTDRLHLEASCHTLLAASRGEHSGVYWGGAQLRISLRSEGAAEQVGPLLAARRPTVAALQLSASFFNEALIDAPVLPTPPHEKLVCVPGLQVLELWHLFIHRPAWGALRHMSLTSLGLLSCRFAHGEHYWAGSQPLRALPALQDLEVAGDLDEEGQPTAPLPCLQLAGCSRLTSLVLERCGLTELPHGFSTLYALQHCTLGGDNLSRAQQWWDFTCLHRLTDLELRLCHLVAVPPSLPRLTGLCRLSLHSNFLLGRGWERLAFLTGLTSLNLSFSMQLERLPAGLSQLTKLRYLALNGCGSLPASDDAWRPLEGHASLQVLQAAMCDNLTAVPVALGTIRSLQYVELRADPHLAGGWHHLAGLTRLGLEDCGLQAVPPELAAFSEAGIVRM